MPYEPSDWLARAVSTFGRSAREQLSTGAGEPEEALRVPLVVLVKKIGSQHGLQVVPVGEAMLSDLQVRPNYAVQVDGAICGYIEIKKPGLGADAPALTGRHNRRQWDRLSNLPNLIYTDGVCWARYETGVRALDAFDAAASQPDETHADLVARVDPQVDHPQCRGIGQDRDGSCGA